MDTKSSAKLKNFTFVLAILFAVGSVYSCSLDPVPEDYQWEIERTSVKNQGNTGTCWAFATISFLESECIRKNITDELLDLSEAFVVYHAFLEKAKVYLKTMGESRLAEGGLAHDMFYLIDKYGIVREDDYEITKSFRTELNKTPWFLENDNYSEINIPPFDSIKGTTSQTQTCSGIFKQMYPKLRLMNRLKHELDSAIKTYQGDGSIPEQAMVSILENIKTILNEEIGAVPEEISYNGNVITPLYFAQNVLGIHSNDYVHITSFEHLSFQELIQLDIPDNWLEYNQYINLDPELFYELTKLALTMQYGLVIDCDISEIGFNPVSGKVDSIIYPDDLDYDEIASIRVDQFQKGITTDDHLMHIVGHNNTISPWFLLKNSFGVTMFGIIPLGTEEYRGYIHMSKIYFLLKTISVTVHKDMLEYFPEIELYSLKNY